MTVSVSDLAGQSAVVISVPERRNSAKTAGSSIYRSHFKRALDILVVVMTAPVVVPLVAMLAAFVAKDGGKPFYSQYRVGKNGRPFRMWKLRTMVVDADARMAAYLDSNPEARAEWDRSQKLRIDPRITRFGQILRKTSLDELPQLWNVFMGDMSLVGPRPMMVNQQSMYPGKAYYLLRPGVTGLWQTTDRNQTTFEARAGFDTTYEETLSLANDVKIVFKTVSVVFKGTGL